MLLAGCVAVPGFEPEPPTEAVVLPWGFEDCRFAVAIVPVPASRVDAQLPEGFAALSFAQIGLPPDPRGDGNVGVELWTCETGAGLDGTVEDLVYGSAFVFVQPPEPLVNPDAMFHFVKFDVLVSDPAHQAAIAQSGAPVFTGSGSFSEFRAQGDQSTFAATMDMNGTYTLRGTALAPADAGLRAFNLTEWNVGRDGLVTWNATVAATSAGAGGGTLGAPAGIVRDLVGGANVQAYYLAGTGAFTNASVTLPPRASP